MWGVIYLRYDNIDTCAYFTGTLNHQYGTIRKLICLKFRECNTNKAIYIYVNVVVEKWEIVSLHSSQ